MKASVTLTRNHRRGESSADEGSPKLPSLSASEIVGALLFNLPFSAEHGFQRRGETLSISCRMNHKTQGRGVLSIELTKEHQCALDLSGVNFTITLNPDGSHPHQLRVITDSSGLATVADVGAHDRVLIQLSEN